MISVLLYSLTCSAKASLVAPGVTAITLSGVTQGDWPDRSLQLASSFQDGSKALQQRFELTMIKGLERSLEQESKNEPMV